MTNDEKDKDYRIITRDIAGKLNIDETHVLMWLLFKSDYKTGESHVLRETLCKVTGFKDVDTISKYTTKFEDLGLLDKKYTYNSDEGQLTTPVTYHVNIPKTNWISFKKDLLQEDIPYQLKAFLVLLKCLCINNTNITYYNRGEIAKQLNMDRGTVGKYIKMAIELKRVIETNKFFIIMDKNIEVYPPRSKGKYKLDEDDKLVREKYKIIHDYCVEKGVIPPPYDYKLMETLCLNRYRLPEAILKEAIDNCKKRAMENYNYYSMEYNLPKLCPQLPPRIHDLQYFLTSLINTKCYKGREQQAKEEKRVELFL